MHVRCWPKRCSPHSAAEFYASVEREASSGRARRKLPKSAPAGSCQSCALNARTGARARGRVLESSQSSYPYARTGARDGPRKLAKLAATCARRRARTREGVGGVFGFVGFDRTPRPAFASGTRLAMNLFPQCESCTMNQKGSCRKMAFSRQEAEVARNYQGKQGTGSAD